MARFNLFNPRPVDWDAERDAWEILSAAIAEHQPSSVWGLYSGGHDSGVALHILSRHPAFSGAVHIATGIGIRATRRHVYETCKAFGWPLLIYRPRADNRYHKFVLEHGFPGPAQHGRMYQRLKERSLDRHIARFKTRWNDRVMLVSGCRETESRRRMGTAEPVQVDGCSVWVAPCVSWTLDDQSRYMAKHSLPVNPVKELLCMSGECLCGAFARGRNELEEIALWYPRAAAEIEDLQERASAAGVPCRWGERPPEPEAASDPAQLLLPSPSIATMCWTCEIRRDNDRAPLISPEGDWDG
jgi:3'-phosphoadenosine 5'-phosphosulfate sulfotransferase (PAPS reductase)/FAD synthetase